MFGRGKLCPFFLEPVGIKLFKCLSKGNSLHFPERVFLHSGGRAGISSRMQCLGGGRLCPLIVGGGERVLLHGFSV